MAYLCLRLFLRKFAGGIPENIVLELNHHHFGLTHCSPASSLCWVVTQEIFWFKLQVAIQRDGDEHDIYSRPSTQSISVLMIVFAMAKGLRALMAF